MSSPAPHPSRLRAGGGAVTIALTFVVLLSIAGAHPAIAADCQTDPAAPECELAQPTLALTPQLPQVRVGTSLAATATLGGTSPTGTLTFRLYPPPDVECSGSPAFTGIVSVSGSAAYESNAGQRSGVEVGTSPGVWRWTAAYSGDSANRSVATGCSDAGTVVAKGRPVIAYQPTPASAAVGDSLPMSAEFLGGWHPTGAINFRLFDPDDPLCAAEPAYIGTFPIVDVQFPAIHIYDVASAVQTSGSRVAAEPGTWRWSFEYPGDANHEAFSSGCGAAMYGVTDDPSAPQLLAQATPATATIGWQLDARARLIGLAAPTGTMTFRLHAPGDVSCVEPLFAVESAVNGNGFYGTPGFVENPSDPMFSLNSAILVGSYRWTASYSGDAQNGPLTTGCGETITEVRRLEPFFQFVPPAAAVPVGDSIDVSAWLGFYGRVPAGELTFRLFSPSDPECVGPPTFEAAFEAKPFGPNSHVYTLEEAHATSGSRTATAPGLWRWKASYTGDAAHTPFGTPCGLYVVAVSEPAVTLEASVVPPSTAVGAETSVQVVLGGDPAIGGTLTFRLYAPGDSTCASEVVTRVTEVNGPGSYVASASTSAVGTWRWIATYSGDPTHPPAGTSCGELTTEVLQAAPSLSTTPVPTRAVRGTRLRDTARLIDGYRPTGSITFRLYHPSDPTCSRAARYVEQVNVVDGAAATVGYVIPTKKSQTGTWNWTATYAGDQNNAPASSLCGSEPVVVVKR